MLGAAENLLTKIGCHINFIMKDLSISRRSQYYYFKRYHQVDWNNQTTSWDMKFTYYSRNYRNEN